QQTSNLVNPAWQDVPGAGTNRNVSLPIVGDKNYFRVRQPQSDIAVGQLPDGQQSLPTKQILRAAGQQIQFAGRPVDLALSPDGKTAFVKNMNNLLVVDVPSWGLLTTSAY